VSDREDPTTCSDRDAQAWPRSTDILGLHARPGWRDGFRDNCHRISHAGHASVKLGKATDLDIQQCQRPAT